MQTSKGHLLISSSAVEVVDMFALTIQQRHEYRYFSANDVLAIKALALEARKKKRKCGWRSIDACMS